MALLRKGEAQVHLPEYCPHTYEVLSPRKGTCVWDLNKHRRHITSRYHLMTPPQLYMGCAKGIRDYGNWLPWL